MNAVTCDRCARTLLSQVNSPEKHTVPSSSLLQRSVSLNNTADIRLISPFMMLHRGGRGRASLALRSTPAKVSKTPLSELAAQLALVKNKALDGAHRTGSIFQNVCYYTEADISKPTFIDCELKNVNFVHCKFRDTEFRNLKLNNVTFLYIDCDNVQLSDLSLEGHLWKTTIVRNATLLGSEIQPTSPSLRRLLSVRAIQQPAGIQRWELSLRP